MSWTATVGGHSHRFDLRDVLAKASPARSGDVLAGCAAGSAAERVAVALLGESRRRQLSGVRLEDTGEALPPG
jgi:ethanolamine ammonia-lyase large subunit